jgi:DNA polymerase-3 subunit beta
MKVSVLQENLANALVNSSRFASSHAQLPVLGNTMLLAKKTKLLVISTNLETSIAISIGAQIEEEGELTVPAKIITELVVNLPSETLKLESDKEQLKISSTHFNSNILGMNASDFPSVPQSIGDKGSLNLPREVFLEGLSQVIFATSIDETRPILTGVLFIFEKDNLTMVATDGFRLSQKKISLKGVDKSEQIVFPKNVLAEVSRLFPDEDLITFDFKKTERQVLFGSSDIVLSSRILEGEFPDFRRIIPKSTEIKIHVDREDLLRGVKLASVFARASANIIKFKINKGDIEISAESKTSGRQKTKIDAKVEGGELEIAFNYRFLEELLHSIKGEEIKIEFSNSNSPGVFTDPKDPNFLHLIMPVKVQS